MKINSIQISGFRKLHKVKINMEDNITVIAGANNSGKTSIIEFLNFVFNSRGRLHHDDFQVAHCRIWCNAVFSKMQEYFLSEEQRDNTISALFQTITSYENPDEAISNPRIELMIQVDYDPAKDDIRNFADYIMELDPTNNSFYFLYRYELDEDLLRKNIETEYEKMSNRFKKLSRLDGEKDKKTISDLTRIIKEMLIQLFANSCKENAYFSDRTYCNCASMEMASFRALFNYQNIMAGRRLDDESSDRAKVLSKNMIDIASQEDNWKDLIQSLPERILQPIQDAHLQTTVREASIETLGDTIEQISQTNGGQAGNIAIDMTVTDEAIQSFLKNITSAKYQIDDFYLSESSQGLGYSNLIYIHLQLEKYRKKIDPMLVNFFVIEEPEAHMHPQMQNVFSRYLFDYYNKQHSMQGIVTTHSHEVVRNALISQLRVLRQIEPFVCSLFDLHSFSDEIQSTGEKEDLIDFYDWFYAISFPDIVFADKVILYEGDTERMLIKNAILSGGFENLRNQYISFVQVGGAYAHNYFPILEYLKIKALILTDLDYDKNAKEESEVLSSHSTNVTINKFAAIELGNTAPTVDNLYNWKQTANPIVIGNTICLAFQGKKDHFARTLEEAMLGQLYGVSAFETKGKEEWKELRKSSNLHFVVPNSDEPISVRAIVDHSSNKKTDFMYSVILNDYVESMLPDYVKEGLLWLAK